MRKLNRTQRVQILRCLVEGNSIRSTARITGFSKNTVIKLLVDIGQICAEYQDAVLRNLTCERIQCDEIWSFVGMKEKNVPKEHWGEKGYGDIWTWTALDADSKLMLSWYVGWRNSYEAKQFMDDVAMRLTHRVQLTTDGHSAYLEAVENSFGEDIDYAQLVKLYGAPPEDQRSPTRRYSPADCTGTKVIVRAGEPEKKHISTSYVERQNLTMRMGMRRFTRLTNAFSKKLENHMHAIALHFAYYNFCRIHRTLSVTPAMEAGVVDHVMDLDDFVAMLEEKEQVEWDEKQRAKKAAKEEGNRK